MDLLSEIAKNLEVGEDEKVRELTQQAIKQKIAPKTILEVGLMVGMNKVGEQFQSREFFLPDVLLAAKAMNAAMEELRPLLAGQKTSSLGKVVMGTVQGDLHDIGKNLVCIMLRGAGFEVIDLGNDVAPEKFVETAKKEGARVIGISALLTTTMVNMKRVVDLINEERLLIKTIIGGAPASTEFAHEIGANAYGYDAANAVEKIKGLFAENMG